MKRLGLQRVIRGKPVKATVPDKAARRPFAGSGLVHHSDRGSQPVSIKYTERLAEVGIEPSVGSIEDSYGSSRSAKPIK